MSSLYERYKLTDLRNSLISNRIHWKMYIHMSCYKSAGNQRQRKTFSKQEQGK